MTPLQLDHTVLGPQEGAPLLLIAGPGAQRTSWPHPLLDRLATAGMRVVTFDNRDVGHSPWLDDLPADPAEVRARMERRRPVAPPPYTLSDMALDVVGLLDTLDIDQAHVLGASMGGMIAQHLGFEHPARIASLICVMSSTGDPDVGRSTPEALDVLTSRAPLDDEDAYVEAAVRDARVISSPTLFDPDAARRRSRTAYRRGINPDGITRQLLALLASGNRTDRLGAVTAPTLVIHGLDDPLIDVSGGRATARAIRQADLVEVEQMAHDLPEPLHAQLVQAIVAHVRRAESAG